MYLNRRVFLMAIYLTPYDAVRGTSTHKTEHPVCTNVECLVQLLLLASRKQTYIILTPLNPNFYTVKLGFTRYTLFFLFLLKIIDCGYSL